MLGIGWGSTSVRIRTNFGQRPFRWGPERIQSHELKHWMYTAQTNTQSKFDMETLLEDTALEEVNDPIFSSVIFGLSKGFKTTN